VAVGGDGTVCEVATGLAQSETALGIIPAGTGNDSILNLGIPADPLAAARHAADAPPRTIDLGEIRAADATMCCVNAAGFGLDPGPFRALLALGEHALHGLEKTPAQKQIEEKDDNDCGDSRKEQLAELVNDLH